ncbi:MAG TPA: aminoglycoside phosphotransferase family protein [Candidatus Limnocylindrales bacterium]|nr:aminoglycoside phosphotransferase family protein [Candidatus Limnocylindrales bacterium]
MSALPPSAAAWLSAHDVRPRTVDQARSFRGLVYLIDDLALRWYASPPEEPDAISHEVAALTAVDGAGIPSPRLVAWTQEPPALLMTRRRGRHRLDGSGATSVHNTLDAIHAVQPGPLRAWAYRGYHEGRAMPRPTWWRDRPTWDRALAISVGRRPPTTDPVLIHRDFHPGNLLWSDAAITGVLDWTDACLGPASFDLAHYRVNIATLEGSAVADLHFPGDPMWDLEAALGYLDPRRLDDWVGPWPSVPASVARERLEKFTARAVAALR